MASWRSGPRDNYRVRHVEDFANGEATVKLFHVEYTEVEDGLIGVLEMIINLKYMR